MRLRKIAIVSLLMVALASSTQAMDTSKYKGVGELILVDRVDLTDNYNIGAILQRCAGLYNAFSVIVYVDEPKTQLALFRKSRSLLDMSAKLFAQHRGYTEPTKAINNEVDTAHDVYFKIYMQSMEENQILTGSIFSELVDVDSKLCKELTDS